MGAGVFKASFQVKLAVVSRGTHARGDVEAIFGNRCAEGKFKDYDSGVQLSVSCYMPQEEAVHSIHFQYFQADHVNVIYHKAGNQRER